MWDRSSETMGRVGSKRDGGGPVEQAGQVASHEPAEGVGDFAAVVDELLDAGAGECRGGVV